MAKQPSKKAVSPFTMQGVHGYSVYSGYIQSTETSAKLIGSQKWKTYRELMANVSIIASAIRLFLTLTARTEWSVEPAKDIDNEESSDDAKKVAELVEEMMHGMTTPWSKAVQRMATYRFNGFHFSEWKAFRRQDGIIGIEDLQVRPCHTIERWDISAQGHVNGVWQRSPQTGAEIYLPRSKMVYLVDDLMTDAPDGMGLLRHLAPVKNRLDELLRNEYLGFTRDLRGIPVGRAPLSLLNQAVQEGQITETQKAALLEGLNNIVVAQAKSEDTGLILDSQPYEGQTADGNTVASSLQWDLQLITGQSSSLEEIGAAIDRTNKEMARILGGEFLMLGDGQSGSRALSEDKTDTFHMMLEGSLAEIAEGAEKDMVDPFMALNGLPEHLKPTLRSEAVERRDVSKVAQTLRDMATAGAVLAPDDPAIDEVRMLLGLSPQPDTSYMTTDTGIDVKVVGGPNSPLPGDQGEAQ